MGLFSCQIDRRSIEFLVDLLMGYSHRYRLSSFRYGLLNSTRGIRHNAGRPSCGSSGRRLPVKKIFLPLSLLRTYAITLLAFLYCLSISLKYAQYCHCSVHGMFYQPNHHWAKPVIVPKAGRNMKLTIHLRLDMFKTFNTCTFTYFIIWQFDVITNRVST
jgi:hypothetical protein